MKKILAALTMAAFTMVVTPSFAQTQPEPQKKEEKKKERKKKGEEKKEEKK
jgi:ribosomal protein L12E/L44/L45/RPP1/RPP2